MNAWLVTALIVLMTMLPLAVATLRRPAIEGLPALQVAGVNASLAFMMLAVGMGRQLFVDLALVTAVLSFAGSVAFAAVLERQD
jgi:multicomponent Na+:H+ antiporter subunit F